ncbi:MAG: prepilin-type N-terminal cleavage/methylation domain-containing protein [Gammaproteobacteria bacterium]
MISFATYFKREKGIGLLELMLALAIIAILIVMATRYFSKASDTQKLTVVQQEVAEIKHAAYLTQQAGTPVNEWKDIQDQLTPTLQKSNSAPYIGSTYSVDKTGVHVNGLTPDICTKLEAKIQEGKCAGNVFTLPF